MESAFFTQCTCVLFETAPAIEAVRAALDDWALSEAQRPPPGEHGWVLSGPSFLIPLRGEGFAVVDVVARPWPDEPAEAEATPALAAAWRAGLFGPLARPGALLRAREQAWSWPAARESAGRQGGFVRLRTGFAVPAGAAPTPPADHDPLAELRKLTELAQPLLGLPGALALFTPGGEALRSREQVEAVLARQAGSGPPPVELWSNLRAVELAREEGVRWLIMDLVGLPQLGVPDQEALFAEGQEEPGAVEPLLRNAALHLLAGQPIPEGATAEDARGRHWRATAAQGLVVPSRPVLRWLPEQSARPGAQLLGQQGPG